MTKTATNALNDNNTNCSSTNFQQANPIINPTESATKSAINRYYQYTDIHAYQIQLDS